MDGCEIIILREVERSGPTNFMIEENFFDD